jgi:hypothetical protein
VDVLHKLAQDILGMDLLDIEGGQDSILWPPLPMSIPSTVSLFTAHLGIVQQPVYVQYACSDRGMPDTTPKLAHHEQLLSCLDDAERQMFKPYGSMYSQRMLSTPSSGVPLCAAGMLASLQQLSKCC